MPISRPAANSHTSLKARTCVRVRVAADGVAGGMRHGIRPGAHEACKRAEAGPAGVQVSSANKGRPLGVNVSSSPNAAVHGLDDKQELGRSYGDPAWTGSE